MKKKFSTRFLSWVLTLCMLFGMFPAIPAYAAETVAPGECNVSTGNITYIFGYNVTQYADIEVLVRETGKPETEVSLGLIAEEVMVYGAEGSELSAKEPEYNNMGATPGRTPLNRFYSDHASLTKGDYYESDTGNVDENGDPVTAPACETIFEWDGRIHGIPILGPDPTQDTFEVVLVAHTLGDITKGCTPCEEDAEGNHIHGENYLWTDTDEEWSNPRTVIRIDYRTFLDAMLNEGGELTLQIQSLLEGSFSSDVLKQMLGELLADNGAPQYLKDLFVDVVGDPIYVATGAYTSTYIDLRLEGSMPLSFLRAYNSRYAGGSLGKGFTHGYEYSLRDDNGIMRVTMPGGEEVIFLRLRGGGYDALQNSPFQLEDDGSGYVMTHRSGVRFLFDADGKLTEIINPSDITAVSFAYDGSGQLTDIHGVAGSFALDWAGGHIVRVTDSAGRTTEYTYSGENLTAVTNCDGDTLYFGYDANGYLSAATDFEGEEYVRNTYDELGRVTEQTFINAGQELTATFSYSMQDENDGSYTVDTVDFYGQERTYFYDKHRVLLRIEDADGISSNGYEEFIPTSATDNQGNTTRYEVDEQGYITAIHYADGGVVRISYNSAICPSQ